MKSNDKNFSLAVRSNILNVHKFSINIVSNHSNQNVFKTYKFQKKNYGCVTDGFSSVI